MRDRTEWRSSLDYSDLERSQAGGLEPRLPSSGRPRWREATSGKRPCGSWLSEAASSPNGTGRCARKETTAPRPRTASIPLRPRSPRPPPLTTSSPTPCLPSRRRRARKASPSNRIRCSNSITPITFQTNDPNVALEVDWKSTLRTFRIESQRQ